MSTLANILPTWLGGAPVTASQATANQAAASSEIAAVGTSAGAQVAAYKLLDNTINLVNGQQYQFSFSGTVQPSSLQNDIVQNAPDFLTSLSVIGNGNALVVEFTYEGDGTDIVSDVAQSIVAAAAANNDSVTYLAASQATGGTVSQAIAGTVAAQINASNADQSTLANQANAAAAAADSASLTSTIVWVIVGVTLFLWLAPKFIAATAPRVSVAT
jgi:hypothetical protein